MIQYLSVNPFTDSDSPWYYVVGVICLLLVFAALAVYLVVSSKKKKKQQAAEEQQKAEAAEPEKTEQSDNSVEKTTEPAEQAIENVEEQKTEEKPAEQEPVEKPAEAEEKQAEPESKEPEPKKVADDKTVANETAEKPPVKKAAPKKTAASPKTAEPSGEAAPKKPKTTKAEKPFIDKIIATKAMHGVYNEVKNTILSYPGIKAKLTKDEELFMFGQDKKASVSLDGTKFVLKLNIDPQKVPSQFNITAADGELPTTLAVEESKIDNAQKLITFAMNVALLTRNDRHRHTDYVQNAINAKNRNKNK